MTTTTDVALKLIATHPANLRRGVGDLTGLTASIRNRGILQNLVVAPAPAGTKKPAEYVLIAGHRRFAAAKTAKLKTVTVSVREDLLDPADQLAAMLEENGHRTDLTAVEESAGIQGLLDYGLNQTQIAALTGMAKTRISERARISKLPTNAKDRLHTHQITLSEALAIGEFDGDDATQAILLEDAGTPNFQWRIRRAQQEVQARKEREQVRKKLIADGVKVLDEVPREVSDDPADSAVEWLDLYDLQDDESMQAAAEHAGVDVDNIDEGHIVAWHRATCKGHAVVLTDDSMRMDLCLTPSTHPQAINEISGGEASSAAAAKAAVERAAETAKGQEFLASLKAAAASRRAHMADVLAEGSAQTATAYLVDHILTNQLPLDPDAATWGVEHRTAQCQALAAVLGVEYSTYDALVAEVTKRVSAASLQSLVLLGAFLERLHAEVDLEGDKWAWGRNVAWLRALSGPFGYEFSEFETALLPKEFAPALHVDGISA